MRYIILFIALIYSVASQAAISIRFQPNPVAKGESVEMILSSDQPFKGVPNLDILKKSFLIGGQQQRHSSQWVNGKGSTSYELSYTLFPYETGDIAIRGLHVGNEVVPDAVLTVGTNGHVDQDDAIKLSVQCSNKTVYPGQKVICEVWLFDSQGVSDGEISSPETEAGVWEQLNSPVYDGVSGNVRRYKTTYSFVPKESGEITIPPFVFRGEVMYNSNPKRHYNSLVDMIAFGFAAATTKPVVVKSEPIRLNIKEKPQDYQGWWLPSSDVTLSETYQMPDSVIVGDPIQRIVTLTAKGVSANEMPVPSASNTKNLKVYSNLEQRKDLGNSGQVQVELTFVPTQAGRVVLPEIRIPWFNVQTEKVEYATLPEKEIIVIEGSESASAPQVENPAPKTLPAGKIEAKTPTLQPAATETISLSLPIVLVIVLLAFLVGALITFLVLKIRHRMAQKHEKKKPLPDLYPF